MRLQINTSHIVAEQSSFSDLEESELSTDTQTVHGYLGDSNQISTTNNAVDGKETRNDDTISTDLIGSSSHQILYRGTIDIILHPIYRVPCPYVQLFDASGQPLSSEFIESLIKHHKARRSLIHHDKNTGDIDRNGSHPAQNETNGTHDGNIGEKNMNQYPTIESSVPIDLCGGDDFLLGMELNDGEGSAEFIFEEHPYLSVPCLCLHVCGLGASLAMIKSSGSPNNTADSIYNSGDMCPDTESCKEMSDKSQEPDLYFLSWFTLVGPALGIDIDLTFYKNVADRLR